MLGIRTSVKLGTDTGINSYRGGSLTLILVSREEVYIHFVGRDTNR